MGQQERLIARFTSPPVQIVKTLEMLLIEEVRQGSRDKAMRLYRSFQHAIMRRVDPSTNVSSNFMAALYDCVHELPSLQLNGPRV